MPLAGPIIDAAGDLFGTASTGGSASNAGTVFELVKGSATISTLASFTGSNGSDPSGELIMDSTGNLYGTTAGGGGGESGTVFEVASGSGIITTLASFVQTDGSVPDAGLVMDSFRQSFSERPHKAESASEGTVFEGGPTKQQRNHLPRLLSTRTKRKRSAGAALDFGLVRETFFGTNGRQDGALGVSNGTVFEVANGSNAITTLASFNGTDGANPVDRLYMDGSGNLYGTANVGGPGYTGPGSGNGTVFEVTDGTIIDRIGQSFNGTNGQDPFSGLFPDSAGNFYGTTILGGGGSAASGTVFELSPIAGPAAQLVFSHASLRDYDRWARSVSPPIAVSVEDDNGLLANTDNSTITLSILSGPSGATLGGTISEPAVNGVATFPDLTLEYGGWYLHTDGRRCFAHLRHVRQLRNRAGFDGSKAYRPGRYLDHRRIRDRSHHGFGRESLCGGNDRRKQPGIRIGQRQQRYHDARQFQ